MKENLAILDADFINHICSIDDIQFFDDFMESLGVYPAVTWYVANEELLTCKLAQSLISSGKIRVIKPDDFLKNLEEKNLFSSAVISIANAINEYELSEKTDIFTSHCSISNLGEIISELVAKEMEIPLFASNDWGAKRIATRFIDSEVYRLQVLNMADLLEKIGMSENKLAWRDIKKVLSGERWQRDKRRLRIIWVKD